MTDQLPYGGWYIAATDTFEPITDVGGHWCWAADREPRVEAADGDAIDGIPYARWMFGQGYCRVSLQHLDGSCGIAGNSAHLIRALRRIIKDYPCAAAHPWIIDVFEPDSDLRAAGHRLEPDAVARVLRVGRLPRKDCYD